MRIWEVHLANPKLGYNIGIEIVAPVRVSSGLPSEHALEYRLGKERFFLE